MAVDMFIKIDDVAGESRDRTNKDWIDVLAWSWGMSNSGSAHTGGGIGAGKANVQDISLTKYLDKSSPALQFACLKGTHFGEANILVRKAGDKPLDYLKIKLEDLIVTSVSTGGSGGEDRLTENVTLNFAKVTLEYYAQDDKGAGKKAGQYTYNIAENAAD
jgi:type VI secretion system secreted protein Hcp